MEATTSLSPVIERGPVPSATDCVEIRGSRRRLEAVMVGINDPLGGRVQHRRHLFESLWREAIGRISLLDLTTSTMAARGCRSLAWDAAAMPAGGHYYPIFVRLIEQFEREGQISPERSVLIETTTGTAGIALGWIAEKLGYRVILFMPEDMPARRRAAVEAQLPNGSELRLTPAGGYVSGMVREFQRFMARSRHVAHDREYFALDHSRRPEAVDALAELLHFAVARCADPIDVAVAALGNGTASSALFRAVRDHSPAALRVGVEPFEAPIVYLRKFGPERFEEQFGERPRIGAHHMIGTGGWGVKFTNLDLEEIDRVCPVRERTWRHFQSDARQRGVDLGNSSAACQSALVKLTDDSPRQLTAFSLRYDTADLY